MPPDERRGCGGGGGGGDDVPDWKDGEDGASTAGLATALFTLVDALLDRALGAFTRMLLPLVARGFSPACRLLVFFLTVRAGFVAGPAMSTAGRGEPSPGARITKPVASSSSSELIACGGAAEERGGRREPPTGVTACWCFCSRGPDAGLGFAGLALAGGRTDRAPRKKGAE